MSGAAFSGVLLTTGTKPPAVDGLGGTEAGVGETLDGPVAATPGRLSSTLGAAPACSVSGEAPAKGAGSGPGATAAASAAFALGVAGVEACSVASDAPSGALTMS